MDDAAMQKLEQEVDMINELIGLKKVPENIPAPPVAPGLIAYFNVLFITLIHKLFAEVIKKRPASVGRTGTESLNIDTIPEEY